MTDKGCLLYYHAPHGYKQGEFHEYAPRIRRELTTATFISCKFSTTKNVYRLSLNRKFGTLKISQKLNKLNLYLCLRSTIQKQQKMQIEYFLEIFNFHKTIDSPGLIYENKINNNKNSHLKSKPQNCLQSESQNN